MGRSTARGTGATTVESARAELSERLSSRRPEIEQAALVRIHAISDPRETADPQYTEGLRAALGAALDYGLDVVERGEERAPAIPAVLLTQARIAARSGVSLDTVLRRYFAGYVLLGDFMIEESEHVEGLHGADLKCLLHSQATIFDRLLAAVSEEHGRESGSSPGTSEQRRAERVLRLLDGEMVDAAELDYELEAHHIGIVAQGSRAAAAIRELAALCDQRLLMVCPEEDAVWAWLGSRRACDPSDLERLARRALPPGCLLALGERARGRGGWRLTHRQAKAVLPIAGRRSEAVVRYGDCALLASILQDDLLATSLRELYLVPLEEERDGGKALREALRAYFESDRNISSAAASLDLSRQAVARRLRQAERRIGRSLRSCATELEAALRLVALTELDPA